MYRSIVLRCAAAYLFCARSILDASRPISAPSGMMVLYGCAATIAKNEVGPGGLHLIDFFSRRPERGRHSGTHPEGGGKRDQIGGQMSPGRAGATGNHIQQGTSSPRQHDQCAARQQAFLDSARETQDDALDEARALEAKGLDEEALLIVSSLIVDNDEFVEAYLERAKIYLNRNMFDLAARDYREAISCSASSIEAHYGLGITCEKWAERLEASGDRARAYEKFREAIIEYKKTLWYSRGHAPAYYGLGCAYSRLGMREDALYYFKRAMENAKRGSDLARRARYNIQLLGGY